MRHKVHVLWVAALAANAATPTEGARDLVRAAMLGELAILAAQVDSADHSSPAGQSEAVLGCMKKIRPAVLVDDLAPELDADLTPQEIDQAEQFFSGAVGERLIKLSVRDLRRKIDNKPQLPVMRSAQEAREIDAFLKTSAGTKLLVENGLSRASGGEKAQAHIREIVDKCVQSGGGKH
jgi:hypothetical protein